MLLSDIAQHRLHNQQLLRTSLQTPQEMVAWLGAVQAQDYSMAKWALGVRLPHLTENIIEKAINDADIIRTHILRPTWHLVSAADIYWMLELSAPQIRRAITPMNRQLELNATIITRSNDVIAKTLEANPHRTREELMAELNKVNIPTNEFRAAHLMYMAEIEGIVCNGVRRGKQLTYALLEERVPQKKLLHREEALAELARRYFTSHGPATLHDFSWWSGLSVADARKGLAAIEADLSSENIDGKFYYFTDHIIKQSESIHLLAAFDEFMVSYKDRSASLDANFAKIPITSNGIFKPIIVVNGQVIGVWKRTLKKDKVMIEPTFFNQADAITKSTLITSAEKFGQFLQQKIEIAVY